MKEFIFIATAKKLTQKCLRISNSFVIIFIWTKSSFFRQTVMLQWYVYIKVSLALHNWIHYGSKLAPVTIILLASCNAYRIRMLLSKQFFTYWKDDHISNNKKNRRTDKYDRLWWISLTLFRKSVCCYFN